MTYLEKLNDLQERKMNLVTTMRSALDAEDVNEENYDNMERDLEKVEKEIKRVSKLKEVEDTMNEVRDEPIIANPDRENGKADSDAQYRDAFEQFLRTPLHDLESATRAVLNTGTGSEGGYLVPEEYLTTVINKLLDRNVVRQNATVMRTNSTTNIPLGDGRPSFSIIAENGAYGDTDASFGQVVLGAYKLGGIIKASDELLTDSFTDVQSYLTGLIVEGIADTEETYFTTGTGSSQPTGLLTGGTLGKTTAGAAAVTLDEMLDLKYALKAPYRMDAQFMMNSKTELAIRKLKDSNGQYLWQPSLQVGAPNTFDGKPILINEKMPDIGTGNKFMLFGNFSYFMIGDRGGLEVKRLNELYSANGQVGWRVSKRFDSKVTQAEAIQYMANA
jgi:HK97 family phage major capsid protein